MSTPTMERPQAITCFVPRSARRQAHEIDRKRGMHSLSLPSLKMVVAVAVAFLALLGAPAQSARIESEWEVALKQDLVKAVTDLIAEQQNTKEAADPSTLAVSDADQENSEKYANDIFFLCFFPN